MRICLCNSPDKPKGEFFDKMIWCPLSGDIVYIVRFLRNAYDVNLSLHVESVFRKYFEGDPEPDIIFFEIEQASSIQEERLIAFYSQSDTNDAPMSSPVVRWCPKTSLTRVKRGSQSP